MLTIIIYIPWGHLVFEIPISPHWMPFSVMSCNFHHSTASTTSEDGQYTALLQYLLMAGSVILYIWIVSIWEKAEIVYKETAT